MTDQQLNFHILWDAMSEELRNLYANEAVFYQIVTAHSMESNSYQDLLEKSVVFLLEYSKDLHKASVDILRQQTKPIVILREKTND
ncbi:hypothetical protein [uncultured Amphritea sp.]|uniref:hypothetical protein n=1 Tax=uncultured Amphritea sp. TaxID=981605 RepID=UPI002633B62B|nr:hypothetical protein [uncultured Amphritea sp.]